MIPVDQLFWPGPRDDQVTLWGPHYELYTGSASDVQVEVTTPAIAANRIFWVTRIGVHCRPGNAQAVTRDSPIVSVIDNAGTILVELLPRIGATESNDVSVPQWATTNIALIGGAHRIYVNCGFTFVAAANSVDLHLSGYMTIRGNAALF